MRTEPLLRGQELRRQRSEADAARPHDAVDDWGDLPLERTALSPDDESVDGIIVIHTPPLAVIVR